MQLRDANARAFLSAQLEAAGTVGGAGSSRRGLKRGRGGRSDVSLFAYCVLLVTCPLLLIAC